MSSDPDGTAGRQAGEAQLSVGDADVKAYQALWLKLARWDWASMVLVPVEPGSSTELAARALAEVGKRLSPTPVTAVTASSLEYGTAMALADLPSFVDRRRLGSAGGLPTIDLPPSDVHEIGDGEPDTAESVDPTRHDMVLASSARVIISVPAVVSEPLGLATTQNADLVILCIELGRSRIADVRRTLDLVGRDRVAGCLLLR